MFCHGEALLTNGEGDFKHAAVSLKCSSWPAAAAWLLLLPLQTRTDLACHTVHCLPVAVCIRELDAKCTASPVRPWLRCSRAAHETIAHSRSQEMRPLCMRRRSRPLPMSLMLRLIPPRHICSLQRYLLSAACRAESRDNSARLTTGMEWVGRTCRLRRKRPDGRVQCEQRCEQRDMPHARSGSQPGIRRLFPNGSVGPPARPVTSIASTGDGGQDLRVRLAGESGRVLCKVRTSAGYERGASRLARTISR